MLNHQEIKTLNPQRYPIALVDRILEHVHGESALAIKAVTAMEPCFAHVADDADISLMTYPRSLMIESFCQAAGPLCAQSGLDFTDKVMLFVSMADVEIFDDVYPGDVMEHHVRVEKIISNAVIAGGEVRVKDRLIMKLGQLVVCAKDNL